MRFSLLIVILSMALLTACGGNNNQPISPVATPASPVATPEAATGSSGSDLSWSHSPAQPIVSAIFCCGFTTQMFALNNLAEATIWGDGRIIWVESGDDGPRRVLTGQLTAEQISALLRGAEEAGFFEWDDRYADLSVADAADKCLRIALEERSKQVCEYVQGAPPAFHDLYAEISSGLGVAGSAYIPERGYLTAAPLEVTGDDSVAEWPLERLGFSLSEATSGHWIEGEILATAWAILNDNWPRFFVREGDTVYQIAVQLPGLSTAELSGP